MNVEQALWSKEDAFWSSAHPRIDDRLIEREGPLAVLSYRVTGRDRALRCRSTYARACGSWMLLEHRQTAA